MTDAGYLGLTLRQANAMRFLQEWIDEKGFSPTFQEIGDALGLLSKSQTHRVVHQLVERGYIGFMKDRARSIAILRRLPERETRVLGEHAGVWRDRFLSMVHRNGGGRLVMNEGVIVSDVLNAAARALGVTG